MTPARIVLTLFAALVLGCVSHEGTYSPSCVAYSGSNIELSDGQFMWEKFTDQVVVDENGKAIDQFPGFPKQGSYRIEGQTVVMVSDAGEPLDDMYLHRREDRYYLLTAEQSDALQESGRYPDCALMLGAGVD